MKVVLNTHICDVVCPDTYGTNFCMYIADEYWDDFKQVLVDKGN